MAFFFLALAAYENSKKDVTEILKLRETCFITCHLYIIVFDDLKPIMEKEPVKKNPLLKTRMQADVDQLLP